MEQPDIQQLPVEEVLGALALIMVAEVYQQADLGAERLDRAIPSEVHPAFKTANALFGGDTAEAVEALNELDPRLLEFAQQYADWVPAPADPTTLDE